MSEQGSLLGFLSDPRLAPYATGDIPVWLWSADATRILWGNPAAAAIFNAASSTALTGHTIDPKGSAALQIARLAGTLPHGAAPRLERLRGFGGRMGGALMCACSRISLADRTPAILVVATEAAAARFRSKEQAQRLLAGCDDAAGAVCAPTARCCTQRRRRRPGSAAPRRSPRSARRRSAPRRSPPAAPKASTAPAGFRSNASAPVHRPFCWSTFAAAAPSAVPAEPPSRAPRRSRSGRACDPSAGPDRRRRRPRRAAPPTEPATPARPQHRSGARRRPSAASRFASSGRWTTTAASRSTPTNSRR